MVNTALIKTVIRTVKRYIRTSEFPTVEEGYLELIIEEEEKPPSEELIEPTIPEEAEEVGKAREYLYRNNFRVFTK